jgi:deazaflavin-dependent oxidoreductase (nitroreductase family)
MTTNIGKTVISPRTISRESRAVHVPLFVPLFNHVVRSFLRIGIPMGPVALLTVKGRKTGKNRRNPVGLFNYKGHRYVFSTFGQVNWVQNVRAAGQATIRKRWHKQTVILVELSPEQAAPILKEVVAPMVSTGLAGKLFGRHFEATPNSPLDDFVEEAKRHPVFELRETN